jgi:peptidoglycan/xylan/chitin deacetylase (PgdA/CDA1 family)
MKRSAISLMDRFGAVRVARAVQRSRAVVLTYHGVLNGAPDYDYLNHNFIAAESFDAQMRYVCRHYRPISLRELVAAYREGRRPPDRSVVVTFDDGFANNFAVAFPILQRHAVPFTVFVTTGLLDTPGAMLWTERAKRSLFLNPERSVCLELDGVSRTFDLSSPAARADASKAVLQRLKRLPPAARNRALDDIERVCGPRPVQEHERDRYEFLTWAQVRELASAGVEIGSHTVSHPILTTLDEGTLRDELVESKRCVEAALGRECVSLAYPNGSPADFGPREKAALRDSGYLCGLSLNGSLNDRPDLYEVDRINVGRHLDLPAFQMAMTGILGAARRTRDAVFGSGKPRQPRPQERHSES